MLAQDGKHGTRRFRPSNEGLQVSRTWVLRGEKQELGFERGVGVGDPRVLNSKDREPVCEKRLQVCENGVHLPTNVNWFARIAGHAERYHAVRRRSQVRNGLEPVRKGRRHSHQRTQAAEAETEATDAVTRLLYIR